MYLFWTIFIIQTIVLIVSAVYYMSTKKWLALFFLIADLVTIPGNYFSKYANFPWTKEIFFFAPVDYAASGYNEGKYYGGWENEYPQGYGRLTYDHFVDGKYYALIGSDGDHKALYYEGGFDHGWRIGQGTVVYEDGYKDVGIFYGKWESGKTVFEGTRWKGDMHYVRIRVVARDAVSADDIYETDYWLTK